MILADPVGSVLAPYVNSGEMIEAGSWTVEGIGEDFIPPNADLSLVRHAYPVADPDSFAAARELLRREGVFAGSSSGTLLAAALRYCKAQTRPKRVVSFVCDTGAKYLSKVFNDSFLAQEGWIDRERNGTVRDLVINRYREGSAVVVGPDDPLRTVFARMRAADVSQLPVVAGERIVGLVDESDLLSALLTESGALAKAFSRPVKDVMITRLDTISADAPIRDLVPLFRKDYVAIVMDADRFLGLVTRIDLINHFRIALQ
jgi:cystathionine beta-synthase